MILSMTNFKDEHFVHMEDTKKILQLALKTKTNIILWGPGGYGKTEIVKHYLDVLGITYNTVVGYKDMMVEALLGIPDMKKLMDESKYEIAFEHSPFVGAKVLVLEEFMDVAPETAAALKDIITEGGYRTKDKFIASTIKQIIIITNKSPEDIGDDDSIKAFYYERFPLHHEVTWSTKTAKKYYDLFKYNTVLENNDCKKLSFICENVKPSPRLALEAVKVYSITKDITDIRHIRGFDNVDIESLSEVIERSEHIFKFNELLYSLLRLIEKASKDEAMLLYIKDSLNSFLAMGDVPEERKMSFITVQRSLQIKLDEIFSRKKEGIPIKFRHDIDEIFRDFKH